ncbi:MAG: CvpA family protein [Clostridia bacterium]|nr:CvpA family protein [Clostridia bacterium]
MDPIKVDFSGKGKPKEVVIPPEKKVLKIIICILTTIIGGGIAYYFMLPAINFKAIELYYFIAILIAIYIVMTFITSKAFAKPEYIPYVKRQSIIPLAIGLVFALVLGIGYLVSAPLFRAQRYSEIIDVTEEEFGAGDSVTTITSLEDFSTVPMIDQDVALNLANKTLGDLSDWVSQFVIDEKYSTQVNFEGNPYRIFPLKYGDVFKWIKNTKEGFPAYIAVNMYTQETEAFILADHGLENIQVSTGEYLNERLDRVLRFKFPTYMFGTPSLEINEKGEPYWVCEYYDKTIGLVGGTDVKGVVLVNACDKNDIVDFKDVEDLKSNEEYSWIDQIYSDDLLIEQYNYYGKYNGGFINGYIGQTGVMTTTVGSSYIASGDDVWLYTGVTSVTNDDSIVGFAIINQRTKEAVFQEISGTTESGAQTSAQGIVSDKGWTATFPLLLNIDGEATYFMALKDNNVVKSYAMVSVERVQDAVRSEDDANPDLEACLKAYVSKVKASTKKELNIEYDVILPDAIGGGESSGGDDSTDKGENKLQKITGVITDIRTAVVNGNSIYYIAVDNKPVYYSISTAEDDAVVILNVGDTVNISYVASEESIVTAKTIGK